MRAIASPMPDDPPVISALGTARCSQNSNQNDASSTGRAARARCEGAGSGPYACIWARPRTKQRAAQRVPATQGFILIRVLTATGRAARTLEAMSAVEGLTSLAKAGGCAAKYSAARLEELLAGIVPAEAHDLLVGLDPSDDAAVYRLDDQTAIVFTVDFFPPVVDDPRTFGWIAATNALNDVYAMGGRPLLALSVTAFPEELPVSVLGEILAGAADATREAGAILAGGHTIRDDEPKYGLAVVGTVHPDGVWLKSGAQVGDVVLVTKPLGTGLILQAVREGRAPDSAFEAAVEAMSELNRDAADALRSFSPNAVTDVTGFGLLGHAHETALRSGVKIVLDAGALPALPGALELAAAGVRTGGDRRNREYAGDHVTSTASPELEALAYDPQTAGGLLIALPAEKRAVLEATFAGVGLALHAVGRVEAGSGVALERS